MSETTNVTESNVTETEKVRKRRAGLEEFIRVCFEEQSAESAAKRLGLTPSSFDQRLRREKARYEDSFSIIDTAKFAKGHVGRTPPKPNEALAMVARIKGMSVEDLMAQIAMQKQQVEKPVDVTANQEAKVEDKPEAKPAKPAKKSNK